MDCLVNGIFEDRWGLSFQEIPRHQDFCERSMINAGTCVHVWHRHDDACSRCCILRCLKFLSRRKGLLVAMVGSAWALRDQMLQCFPNADVLFELVACPHQVLPSKMLDLLFLLVCFR